MSADATAPPADPAQHVLQLSSGYIVSTAMYLAAKLEIADHLAAGRSTIGELARATGANEGALYRVLRLLASLGVFDETGPRSFALTPVGTLLRKGVPGSLHGIAVFLPDPLHFRVYANAIDSVLTGKPALESTVGMPGFEYLRRNPEYSEVFNQAMTTLSATVVPATLEAYDFSGIKVLVDIAGGHGELLTSILQKYPTMRGILTEVDHVVAGAIPRIADLGLADRCEAVAADLFKTAPAGADAYMLKNIIHDWDDEHCEQILRTIHTAMGSKRGKVLLLEMMIPAGREPSLGKIIDIEMLLWPGGLERTANEFRALFDHAGFDLTAIIPTKSPVTIVEALKR